MDRDRQMSDHEPEANEIARTIRMRSQRRFTFEFVLKTYATLGLLVAIGALVYLVLTMIDIEISETQQFTLIVGGSGVALSIMSWLILSLRQQREFYEIEKLKEYAYTAELIESWANFEEVSRNLLKLEGDKFGRYSLRSIISTLKQEEKITEADLHALQEALEIRNVIVHGRANFSQDAIIRITTELSDIIAKLSRETAAQP